MRDPAASIVFEDSLVIRHLKVPLSDDDFLSSALASRLVAEGLLVSFRVVDASTVESPRLPFVTYPFEWCDSQLHAAAMLTLRVQQNAVAGGFDLKDASAWNVIFAGTIPVFCDLLSFEPLFNKRWWAMGQFSRHFAAPLAVSRTRRMRAYRIFQAWRDGLPLELSRRLLGFQRFGTRYWPLLAGMPGKQASSEGAWPGRAPRMASQEAVKSSRDGLQTALHWMLMGIEPRQASTAATSCWDQYPEQRGHYLGQSVALKKACVSAWIERAAPCWVADLGCNTGEFSELAMRFGARVVALDSDHDSVQRMFQRLSQNPRIHPVVVDLDDLSGGRGWAGSEFRPLAERLRGCFDLVMVLALVHHLAVASAVPLEAIARFCAQCTRDWLIFEVIEESDVQLQSLCAQRKREPAEFTRQRQLDALLAAGFEVVEEVSLRPTPRSLLLLRRKA